MYFTSHPSQEALSKRHISGVGQRERGELLSVLDLLKLYTVAICCL